MSQSSVIPVLQKWISEPWGHPGRRTMPVICQPLGCSHSLHSGCEELQDSGPRQLRYTWKEWFHWTQTPASPHIEKNTKFLNLRYLSSAQSLSCVWLCNPMDCSTTGFPVHHQLLELTQTPVHRVGDAIQPFWFSLINNILLMFRLPTLCYKTSI